MGSQRRKLPMSSVGRLPAAPVDMLVQPKPALVSSGSEHRGREAAVAAPAQGRPSAQCVPISEPAGKKALVPQLDMAKVHNESGGRWQWPIDAAVRAATTASDTGL